ncbi:MAG: hypothetical protein LBM64_02705 [Deltaproteobacteria bacterium]|jgi:hypothetical protein|nr:hypothetical protein [Deltaproteobacteria bacterium]
MRKNPIKKTWRVHALLVVLGLGLLFPAAAGAALEPLQYSLGDRIIKLSGPAGHHWVDKDSILALKLVPPRYEQAVTHMISLYAREASLSLTRPYHNYGALFFVGPKDKIWTEGEFAELKRQLMPGGPAADKDELEERYEFMRRFLREGVGFKLTRGKAKKYYERLQKATVLRDAPQGLALSLLQQKKGEKDTLITLSLSLARGKLVGTLYYQIDPGQTATARSRQQTLDWQDALMTANG